MIFLGIDCGTQSTKVVALEADSGEIVAQAQASHELIAGLPPGHMEQHPSDWIAALEQCLAIITRELGDRRGEIAGMGVSGQQHGLVALNEKYEVIRPAKLWCDTSTSPECDEFRAAFGGTAGLVALMGNDMLPGFTAPKLLWIKRHEPENFARIRHVALPHDYLNWYLTGNLVMEFGDASGTALLDVRKKQWCQPLVDFIDPALMRALPTVGSSLISAGRLRPELASRWGLKNSIAISMGGGDNMMGAIGTGNVEAGTVTASLGTSGTIYARANQPVIDPSGEIAAFCDSTDGWLPLLCTMNVTVATEAARTMLGFDHAGLERAVLAAPPGAGGLLFLPYLQGERTPNLPQGSGVLHGLTTSNMTPAHLARATMEGATLGLAYGLERLRTLGIAPTEIRLTGGGSKSAVWRQLCADIFGCPVTTLRNAEGAALGGAIQALALVEGKPLGELVSKYVQINPDETHRPRNEFDYGALLMKHTALTQVLAEKSFL